jgi:hypothetical protein
MADLGEEQCNPKSWFNPAAANQPRESDNGGAPSSCKRQQEKMTTPRELPIGHCRFPMGSFRALARLDQGLHGNTVGAPQH